MEDTEDWRPRGGTTQSRSFRILAQITGTEREGQSAEPQVKGRSKCAIVFLLVLNDKWIAFILRFSTQWPLKALCLFCSESNRRYDSYAIDLNDQCYSPPAAEEQEAEDAKKSK